MLKGQGDAYEGEMGISRISMRSKFILLIKIKGKGWEKMKKVISLVLMCLLLINTLNVMAFSSESPKYDAGEALLRELIDRQLSSITTGVFINIDDITIDTEQMQMYNRFMEWRVVEAVALNTTYSKYDFYINDYSVNPDGLSATAYLSIRVEYANGAGEGGYSNYLQEVEFTQTPDGLKISGYSSQDDMMRDFYDLYNKQLSEVKNPDLLLDIMIKDIYDLAVEMEEAANNPSIAASIEITPAAIGSCSYNAANGVAYADKYAYTSNPCFVILCRQTVQTLFRNVFGRHMEVGVAAMKAR